MNQGRSTRWKVLAAAYLASFAFGLSLQSVPPVLPLLIRDLNLTHAEAGLTMSLFALPMVFLSIPAGMIADRRGPRQVGLVAFLVVVLGNLLAALGPGFPLLLAGRALTGIGALTLVLIAPQFISQWFAGKDAGVAMGIWNTAVPLSIIVSFATMGAIGETLGWRAPLLIVAGAAAIFMAAFGLLTRSAHTGPGHLRSGGSIYIDIPRAGLSIWFIGLAWLFFNASTISFMAFAPDYFRSQGFGVTEAGIMSSFMISGSLIVAPLVGMLLDRGARGEALIVAGSLGLALALSVLPLNPDLAVPALIFGAVVNSMTVVSVFALPPTMLRPDLLGLGYGILATCLNIGTALGPLVAGLARDFTGSYAASFWAMAAMALLMSVSIAPRFASQKAG